MLVLPMEVLFIAVALSKNIQCMPRYALFAIQPVSVSDALTARARLLKTSDIVS